MFEGWLIKEGTPLGKRFGNFRRASFVPREARRSKGEGKVFDKFPLPLPRHKDDAFFVKHDALAVFLRFNPRCTPPPLFFYRLFGIQCFIIYELDTTRMLRGIIEKAKLYYYYFSKLSNFLEIFEQGSFIGVVQSIYVQWRTWLMEKYFLPFVPHFIVRSTIIRSVFPGLLIVPLFETFHPFPPPLNIVPTRFIDVSRNL